MTSAATAPDLTGYEAGSPYISYGQVFNEAIVQGVWESYAGPSESGLSIKMAGPRCFFWSHSGTAEYELKLVQYGDDLNALIIVDFGETTDEFPKEDQQVVKLLRENGRPILARKLVTMLRNTREDPDEPTINIVSLRDMARLLVEHNDFADPFIGPDRLGIIHAQWRIIGNGVLVVSFLGYGEILLVAQADESPDNQALDVSRRGPDQEILEEFGHLVPRRY